MQCIMYLYIKTEKSTVLDKLKTHHKGTCMLTPPYQDGTITHMAMYMYNSTCMDCDYNITLDEERNLPSLLVKACSLPKLHIS